MASTRRTVFIAASEPADAALHSASPLEHATRCRTKLPFLFPSSAASSGLRSGVTALPVPFFPRYRQIAQDVPGLGPDVEENRLHLHRISSSLLLSVSSHFSGNSN